MNRSPRVLLVDDHQTVREGLRALFDATGEFCVVGDLSDGGDAADAVAERGAQVVVLDLSMPVNGLVALRRIKSQHPDVAVVVLTRHRDQQYVRETLAAGADAYVLKQSPFGQLRTAVLAAARHERFIDPGLTPPASESAAQNGSRLSGREAEVLRMGASGLANKDIATALGIAVKTVEVHKSNAMRKLNLRDRREVVKYALLHGWLQTE
jgi:DNA-binding NarL/FixJ family response regulator